LLLLLLVAFILVLALAGTAARFYTDLLWFQELQQTGVFWGVLGTRIVLGLVAGLVSAAVIGANLTIAERLAPRYRLVAVARGPGDQYRALVGPYLRPLRIGISIFLGLIIGLQSSGLWETFVLWRHRIPFNAVDPQFNRDIGFYVFELPMQRAIFGWLFATLLLTTILVAIAHYLLGGIRPQAGSNRVAPAVVTHLSILLGLIVLLKAWAYRLDQFELLYSERGHVTGAGFTDVNAHLPALQLLLLAALVTAALFFWCARQRSYVVPVVAIAALCLISVLFGGVIPAVYQRFRVDPQELAREEPYIQRNINATLNAFSIQRVQQQGFPADSKFTSEDLPANADIVDNIRLWEPTILETAIANLQTIGQYYDFNDVDVDRYEIDGQRRLVMISVREVNPGKLQESSRTWQNVHLAYTHGYGVVATQVNTAEPGGRPSFLVSGFGQQSGKIALQQPRVYFGELPADAPQFIIGNTRQQEVGAPTETGEGGESFRYDGSGGVPLSNPLRRVAFALRFRDPNVLLSGNITQQSRLLFNRDIGQRLERVAPFLQWDTDPYPAVVNGRIVFIRDGYTSTDMYPYVERISLDQAARNNRIGIHGRSNYLRNSVKAVVDAYTGETKLYVWDTSDPILAAWRSAFPDLFQPREALDQQPELVGHFRYPEDLFAVQSNRYLRYHMVTAGSFYENKDLWDLPEEASLIREQSPAVSLVNSPKSGTRARPYYLLTKLPGMDAPEFVLVTPFTPNNTRNMISYFAARIDTDGSSKLQLLRMPPERQINGPAQATAQIVADPEVSRDVTLFNQQGSEVRLGNLMTVPIEQSLLYVQPIFVQARGNAIPELKKVAVFYADKLGYADTLPAALRIALGVDERDGGGTGPPPTTSPPSTGQPGENQTVAQLIDQAARQLDDADAALRRGDLAAYQQGVERARQLLEQANRLQRGQQPSGPTTTTPP
jgi:uncharacterized membrane protein (UPF0182 family)